MKWLAVSCKQLIEDLAFDSHSLLYDYIYSQLLLSCSSWLLRYPLISYYFDDSTSTWRVSVIATRSLNSQKHLSCWLTFLKVVFGFYWVFLLESVPVPLYNFSIWCSQEIGSALGWIKYQDFAILLHLCHLFPWTWICLTYAHCENDAFLYNPLGIWKTSFSITYAINSQFSCIPHFSSGLIWFLGARDSSCVFSSSQLLGRGIEAFETV